VPLQVASAAQPVLSLLSACLMSAPRSRCPVCPPAEVNVPEGL